MTQGPSEMNHPKYHNPQKYPYNFYKYLVVGDNNPAYSQVKTCSKIGLSYGFVTETAYIEDPQNHRAYVITVSLYVNENETINDGKYEYETVARPFLAKLGQALFSYDNFRKEER